MSTAQTGRVLNDAQHNALDRIAEANPEARVTGWVDQPNFGRGPVVENSAGQRSLVNVTGRTRSLR